jgi:hypothetical protein
MSSTAKILATLAVVAVLMAVIWLGFFRGAAPVPQPPPVVETRPVATNASPFFTKHPRAKNPGTNVAVAEIPPANTNLMADWEEKLEEILRDETEVEAKAKQMLELLPGLPEDGQVEAAQHIANLIPDEDYAKFGSYLTNTLTPVAVQEVILNDVLNRPNGIKLPLLLETARNPVNAKAGEARELLELYLEKDYGDDWDKWQNKMEAWLKENPD